MQGDINREVFPTFLANKSYDWWITRRRMKIYTKISKRKDLMWSRKNRGDFAPKTHGLCEFRTSWRCCANFAQAWSSCLPKAISSSFQLQIVHGLSVGFLTSWALKWYISCRKWTSGSAPKVPKNTAAAVLYFPLCFFLLLFASLCFSPFVGFLWCS